MSDPTSTDQSDSQRADAAEQALAKTESELKTSEGKMRALEGQCNETATALEFVNEVLSHDLRASVRGLRLATKWLREELGQSLTSEGEENLGFIESKTEQLDGVVDQVLDTVRNLDFIDRASDLQQTPLTQTPLTQTPLTQTPLTQTVSAPTRPAGMGPAPGVGSILLVEDDEVDVRAFSKALDQTQAPVSLVAAANAADALSHLSGQEAGGGRPDLVLSDINLPGMDGLVLLKVIREDRGLSRVPVFILSSAADDHMVTEAYRLGATGYIIKPLDPSDWTRVVDGLMAFSSLCILPP